MSYNPLIVFYNPPNRALQEDYRAIIDDYRFGYNTFIGAFYKITGAYDNRIVEDYKRIIAAGLYGEYNPSLVFIMPEIIILQSPYNPV